MADRDPKMPQPATDLFAALKAMPMPPIFPAKTPPETPGLPAQRPADSGADPARKIRELEQELARVRGVGAQAQRQAAGLAEERDRLAQERDWLAGERAALLAERERLVAELGQAEKERDELRLERDRLVADQRALRGARREVPRTGNELRAWREERGLNQEEAARQLQVGVATVQRAEARRQEAPLGKVLLLALSRDAAAVREAAKGAGEAAKKAAAPAKRGTKRGKG